MPLQYEQNFSVAQFECDPWDRMSPGAMLRRAQEIATIHCNEQGLDQALYQRTHTLFLLSRISLEISRPPAPFEEVRLETVAYGMHRAVYHRVTTMYSPGGETLWQADSRWVLIDTETRRILRKAPEEISVLYGTVTGEEAFMAAHDMKMTKPEKLTPLGEERAVYSLCDRNGHINNSRYADLMCDHLPLDCLAAAPPRKLLLSYHNEIPLGSDFGLRGGQQEENCYYFTAENPGTKYFEGMIAF